MDVIEYGEYCDLSKVFNKCDDQNKTVPHL